MIRAMGQSLVEVTLGDGTAKVTRSQVLHAGGHREVSWVAINNGEWWRCPVGMQMAEAATMVDRLGTVDSVSAWLRTWGGLPV